MHEFIRDIFMFNRGKTIPSLLAVNKSLKFQDTFSNMMQAIYSYISKLFMSISELQIAAYKISITILV